MQKIKVAQIITRMDWGGTPDILRIICTYLSPDLYDLTLISGPTRHPSAKTREFLEKFRGNIIIIPELKRNINPVSDLAALIRLYLVLRRKKFDIIHTHTAKAGALGRMAAYLAGNKKVIHMPHGHNFYGYFNFLLTQFTIWIERFLAQFTTLFIALTELEKKDLLDFGIAEGKKIRVVYSGIEAGLYDIDRAEGLMRKKEFGLKEDDPVVGMVSRLERVKGAQYFIEAAAEILRKNPGVKFLIVGEGSLRGQLEKKVKRLGLSESIKFCGWRQDVPEIISSFDILVQPSLNEAVGMVLLEAQCLGIPVVATRVGGIPEIVVDGQTGMLVAPADSRALTECVYDLLTDTERRKKISARSKAWIEEKFSARKMVENIGLIYEEMKGQ